MRIVSLLPSATEIVYALELQDDLVGVTPECAYPTEAKTKPVLVESTLFGSTPDATEERSRLTPREIDTRVRTLVKNDQRAYRFKEDALKNSHAELILTHGLCDVCAIGSHYAIEEIRKAKIDPQILSLDPEDITGIFTDIRRVGEMTGKVDRAGEVVDLLEERVGEVAGRTRDLIGSNRPRVAVIEWTDPLYFAGHWVPEMISLAGGRDVLASPGEPSRSISWSTLTDAAPEILIIAPCGFDKTEARKQTQYLSQHSEWKQLPAVKSGRVYLLDTAASLTRPGPSIVDGLETLAHLIHPELFPVLENAKIRAHWEQW